MLKRKLYYLLSPNCRLLIRRLYYFPADFIDTILGKRDYLTPPRGLVFVGYGDFKKAGEQLLRQIESVYKINPDAKVLDVGCGIGRLAVPLTRKLNPEGTYDGFDIVKAGIDWCNKHIRSRYSNFNFKHIDLKNDLYNLKTAREAKSFVFPYNDNSFDLVVLTSVFTHMMPEDVDNYLSQIRRVLKPDGKCFVTFFLLNVDTIRAIEKRNYFNFPYKFNNYRLLDENVKEANIAYEEKYLMDILLPKNKLKVDNIHYGWWSDKPRENCISYQDVVVLSKTVD